MTEPATSLEGAAIAWAAGLVATSAQFQIAVGASGNQPLALQSVFETDQPFSAAAHAVVEVDSGDLRRDGDAMQGLLSCAVVVLLPPVNGLSEFDALRRARNVLGDIRAQFNAQRHVLAISWEGPARLPTSSNWPEWFGATINVRVIGSE